MAVPNMQHVVERVDRDNPGLIKNPHAFTALVCAALHQVDGRFGLNGKRGNPHDTSEDCTAALDPGSPLVGSDGRRIRIIDFVLGAGGDNPRPGWIDQTDETIRLRTTGVWVQPDVVAPGPTPAPPPTPTPITQPPASTDLSAIKAQLAGIRDVLQILVSSAATQGAALADIAQKQQEVIDGLFDPTKDSPSMLEHIDDVKNMINGGRGERFR